MAKHLKLEHSVLTWIKEMRSDNFPQSGPIVMVKAAEYALCLTTDDFKASEGWLHHFWERHVFRTVPGEGKEVDGNTCTKWRSDALKEHLNTYSPCDIFNVDETALF